MPLDSLRSYSETHIDEHIPVLTGYHDNALFYNCTIDAVKDVQLHNCVMTSSKFQPQNLSDMQGLTLTLDCYSFAQVELNEDAFDYMVMLLIKTSGNTAKREKLIEAIGGKARLMQLLQKTRR